MAHGPGGEQLHRDFATPTYVAGLVAQHLEMALFLWRRLHQLDPCHAEEVACRAARRWEEWAALGPPRSDH